MLVADARFALRQLKRSPLFTLVAVVSLALGIGANTAVFALANATWLRPLPFLDPDRLVMVSEQRVDGPTAVAPGDFFDWTRRASAFQALAAIAESTRPFVPADGIAEPLPTQAVSAQFFDLLGVRPVLGRTFAAADEQRRADVVILSEAFWRHRLGSDRSLVGRSIRLDGRPFTVIGVVPSSMQLLQSIPNATGATSPTAAWTVLVSTPEQSRQQHYLKVVGRLKAGMTPDAARRDIVRVADSLAREHPETNRGHSAALEPLRTALIGSEVSVTSLVLLALAGCVMLLCCANIANLLVTRSVSRRRELAVRSAMGASPGRLATQLIAETTVLSLLGGGVGAATTWVALRVAPRLVPAGLLPLSVAPAIDPNVVAFGCGVVLLVSFLCGVAPARYGARVALGAAMAEDNRTTGTGVRFRSLVAAAQVAGAMVLLCGAALLLRSFIALEQKDPGYRADNILTAVVKLPFPFTSATPYQTTDALRRYYDGVERAVRTIPGVRRIAWGTAMPLDGSWLSQPFEVAGDTPRAPASRELAEYQIVSASYFSTLGIPVLEGRAFVTTDEASAPPVCIVNEAFVRRYLHGRSPIGMRLLVPQLAFGSPVVQSREIVGMVRQVRALANESFPAPSIYVPQAQNPWYTATLMVQSSTLSAEALVPAVRAAVAGIDPDQPLTQVRTLATIAADATARWRFRAQMAALSAVVALTLALVGVFGLLAYTVQQRKREFVLRLAIGAQRGDITRLALRGVTRVTAAGIAIGVIGAIILSHGLASLLFGIQPLDGLSFSSATAVLVITAVVAATGPVMRVARLNPAATLRNDS